MKSFLDVIGNEVVQLTQNYLNAVRRFKNLFNHILFTISCQTIIEKDFINFKKFFINICMTFKL